METTEILGVKIACIDQQRLIDQALDWSKSPGRYTIHYANAHSLNLAYQDVHFRALLNAADLVYADGISLAWSSRLLGGCRLHKLTGADWIGPLCRQAASQGIALYLLGGRPGIAQQAAKFLLKSYPSLTIVGAADGFFQEKSASQIIAETSAGGAGLMLVGLGVPQQVLWIAAHRQALPAGLCWGVGALLDFVAGAERRAPGWLNCLGLEWLWRLGQDPAGKWRRYLLGNPLFVGRVLSQFITRRPKIEVRRK
jgi:N-acetylglucosaminyldiphosphoundecaprenol N-acetyl-beta-D-mannosaminyltransferase